MALTSSQYGALLDGKIQKTYIDEYTMLPEIYTKYFKTEDSQSAVEVISRAGGIGQFQRKGSLDAKAIVDATTPIQITFIHDEYGAAVKIERTLIEDRKDTQILEKVTDFARQAKVFLEQKTADLFNKAFDSSAVIFDQKSLCADHVALDGKTVVPTRLKAVANSNNMVISADSVLTDASLKAAITQMKAKSFNDSGQRIFVQPNMLVVPPALEFAARTILQSDGISYQGNGAMATSVNADFNSKNTLPSGIELVVNPYLTSDTAWFLLDTNVTKFMLFWRRKLEIKKGQEDILTDVTTWAASMRFSYGAADFRGIIGSAGTGAKPTPVV